MTVSTATAATQPRALVVGDRVRFTTPHNEAHSWWTVRAGDERYTVLTRQRPFRPKGELLYTIIDRQRDVRGPCNLVGQGWDVETPGGCDELLRALQRHDELLERLDALPAGTPVPAEDVTVEVSYRNNVPIEIADVQVHTRDREQATA